METTQGPYIFKASPKRRTGEIEALRALSARWSRHVPAILDADLERNWMLMPQVAGEPLDSEDPDSLAEAARLIARIQIEQAGSIERWGSIGCPDRTLETIVRSLPRLLAEIPGRLSEAGVLSSVERDAIASLEAEAREICRRLAEHTIPQRSIHHEDFRDGNVLRAPDGNLVIIDWNDVVIPHPFFTVQRFLWFMDPPEGDLRHRIADDDVLRCALRDGYLEPFSEYEYPGRLLEAFELSCKLAPLYDALRFEASANVDEILDRGLTDEEEENARELMEQMLEVSGGVRGARRWWMFRF